MREKETHIFGDRLRSDLSTLPKIHISQNFEYSSINTTVLSFFVCGLETTLWRFFTPIKFIRKAFGFTVGELTFSHTLLHLILSSSQFISLGKL